MAAQNIEPIDETDGLFSSASEFATDIFSEAAHDHLVERVLDGFEVVKNSLMNSFLHAGVAPAMAKAGAFVSTFVLASLPLPDPKPGHEQDSDILEAQREDELRKAIAGSLKDQITGDMPISDTFEKTLEEKGIDPERCKQALNTIERMVAELADELGALDKEFTARASEELDRNHCE